MIVAVFGGAAAIATVGGVGYCTKVNHLEERINQLERENSALVRDSTSGVAQSEEVPPIRNDSDRLDNTIVEVQDSHESLGFKFELLECLRRRQTISCSLTVENLRADRSLYIKKRGTGRGLGEWRSFKGARIFDGRGTEYFAHNLSLAATKSESEEDVGPEAMLISGIKTPIGLEFKDVPLDTVKISRMFLNCWDFESRTQVEIVFKDIRLRILD